MKYTPKSHYKVCYACDSDTTLHCTNRYGYQHAKWYRNDPTGLWLCHKCYLKHILIDRHKKRITFKDKMYTLSFNPRTGKCSNCHNTTQTQIHHIQYFTIFKWFGTVELCISCHVKESWRLGSYSQMLIDRTFSSSWRSAMAARH